MIVNLIPDSLSSQPASVRTNEQANISILFHNNTNMNSLFSQTEAKGFKCKIELF